MGSDNFPYAHKNSSTNVQAVITTGNPCTANLILNQMDVPEKAK